MIKRQSGVGVVEVMIVLIIVGVLVGLGYPVFKRMRYAMESHRVKTMLQSVLYEARAHSHITKQDVIVCLTDEALQCHRQANAFMVAFVDKNANLMFDEADVLLTQERLALKYGQLIMTVSLHRPYMKYFGQTSTPKGHYGHVSYCGREQAQGYSHRMVINAQGRLRVQRGC